MEQQKERGGEQFASLRTDCLAENRGSYVREVGCDLGCFLIGFEGGS